MLEHDLVLKSDELYLVGEISTDGSGERATGLYLRDTRFLSHFFFTLDGQPLHHLTDRTLGPATAWIMSANGLLPRPDGEIFPQSLGIAQMVTLTDRMTVEITLANYLPRAVEVSFGVTATADFRDLFDIRGFPRTRHGTLLPVAARSDGFRLSGRGLDERVAATDVSFDAEPAAVNTGEPELIHSEIPLLLPGLDRTGKTVQELAECVGSSRFDVCLEPHGVWRLTITVRPVPATDAGISREATLRDGRPPTPAILRVDDPAIQMLLERAANDLAMLQTSFPEGSLPAAGIPWYVAPFGRDSLIVGLQTSTVGPRRAHGILRVLAAHQGTEVDAWREEEPGKILHEIRYGEMARLGEIPHTPYYGSVDATPLFVMLFARVMSQLQDPAIYDELVPHVRRALEWMDRYGDADGDGLLEYVAREPDGVHIVHQGWKDSHDSLHHADGSKVFGSVALVEVQGYAYAAYAWLAEAVEARGDRQWAGQLRQRAERVQAAVERQFWMEDEGYYAQALDAAKQPVVAISSNPGHLLFCGLPSADRAARVAARLRQPDLDSGRGIRTLGTNEVSYNPLSYHNGSVWPHDNSLIAAGLARYGFTDGAEHILDGLIAVGKRSPLGRLPELFCGFARDETDDAPPVPYPVSCSPQAWAAASIECIVVSMLRLATVPGEARLATDAPALPASVSRLELQGVRVGDEVTEYLFTRIDDHVQVWTTDD